jgi:DNA polymerase-3 subunit chi
MNPKIIFLKVVTNQEKLLHLTKTIQRHFDMGEKISILCPSLKVAEYIDELLWRMPEDSFIPHKTLSAPSSEHVAITCQGENFNNAQILINLCKDIPAQPLQFQVVYDLFDQTDAAKEDLSRARFSSYGASGFQPLVIEG